MPLKGAYITRGGKPVWDPNADAQVPFSKRDQGHDPCGSRGKFGRTEPIHTSLSPSVVRNAIRNPTFVIPAAKRSALLSALRPLNPSAASAAAAPLSGSSSPGGMFEGIDPVGQAAIGGAASGAALGLALGPQGALLGAGLGAAIGGLGSFFSR